jgi:hypothetical protein
MTVIKAKEFLEIFEKIIKSKNNIHSSDRALHLLLIKYEKELPDVIEDIEWFHKMFRQTDVTNEKHMDMVIWNLIGCSEDFWHVYNNYNKLKRRLLEVNDI